MLKLSYIEWYSFSHWFYGKILLFCNLCLFFSRYETPYCICYCKTMFVLCMRKTSLMCSFLSNCINMDNNFCLSYSILIHKAKTKCLKPTTRPYFYIQRFPGGNKRSSKNHKTISYLKPTIPVWTNLRGVYHSLQSLSFWCWSTNSALLSELVMHSDCKKRY
jgi:hypothetical protein